MFTNLRYPLGVLGWTFPQHRSFSTFYPTAIAIPRAREILLLLVLFAGWGRGEAGKLNTQPSDVLVAEAPEPVAPDMRAGTLRAFLGGYNSPLTPYAEHLVATADKYSLDWRLLPAIAGTESTFGKRVPRGSHNPFGWGNGRIYFASWEEGIETAAKVLYEKYSLSGQRNLDLHELGKIYAESPRWPKNVNYFMQKIEAGPAKLLAIR